MTDIGVPGTLDGPPIEPNVIGEVVVSFLDSGKQSVRWQKVADRPHRYVIEQAVIELTRMLDDDMLEKLEQDPPREPPL